jgi:hypothetical protein
MNRDSSRFLTVSAALVAAFVFIAVYAGGLAAGWVALGVIAAITTVIAGWIWVREEWRIAREQSQPAPAMVTPPPQPAPQLMRLTITDVPLPSAEPSFPFLLTALVGWYPNATGDARQRVPATVAINSILRRAERVAAIESPANCQSLAYRLAMELGIAQTDPTATVTAWAASTSLRLSDGDAELLHRMATADKRERVLAHERALGRQHRDYLTEDVFSSTGSAAVWWLARDDSRVGETVGLIDAFGRLATEVNPAAQPTEIAQPPAGDPATDAVARLIPEGGDRRTLFSDDFASLLERYKMTAEADRIRSTYGAPTFAEMPDDAPTSDGADPYDLG